MSVALEAGESTREGAKEEEGEWNVVGEEEEEGEEGEEADPAARLDIGVRWTRAGVAAAAAGACRRAHPEHLDLPWCVSSPALLTTNAPQ